MSAPIRIPQPGEVIAVVRNSEDMREALRAIKAIHGLSNTWCDDTGGLTSGHTDKVLGPSATKGMSAMTFDVFTEMFAVEFHMVLNMDAVRRMEDRWKRRSEAQVALRESVISKKLIKQAKPHVFRQTGQLGGMVRCHLLTPKQRTDIARKAAKSRWRKARRKRAA